MATAVVSVAYLSSYLSVPETTLVTLVDEPTKELVNAVLQAVTARAREHDEANANKLHLEVELENAVRTGDSRTRSLKASVEKGLNGLAELREKLKEEGKIESGLIDVWFLISPLDRKCSICSRVGASECQIIVLYLHLRSSNSSLSHFDT
jgi:nucleoprotein TPR